MLSPYQGTCHIVKLNKCWLLLLLLTCIIIKKDITKSWEEPHLRNISENIPVNLEGLWLTSLNCKYFLRGFRLWAGSFSLLLARVMARKEWGFVWMTGGRRFAYYRTITMKLVQVSDMASNLGTIQHILFNS